LKEERKVGLATQEKWRQIVLGFHWSLVSRGEKVAKKDDSGRNFR
jgi:hypothetical protein